MKETSLKKLPPLLTDEEAEDFVANADLTEYDLSGGRLVQFKFKPQATSLNLDLPNILISKIKSKAEQAGLPYTSYIRKVLEEAVA